MKTMIKILVFPILLFVFFSCSKQSETVSVAPETNPLIEKSEYNWPPALDEVKVNLEDVSQNNYYIIFDGSGSMTGSKIKVAKKALKRFIQLIPEEANIGLTAFNRRNISERAALGSSKENIISKMEKIRAGGGTPLGEAVEIAYKKLGIQAKKQLGYGDYNLIIITDGQASDEDDLIEAIDLILKESPIIIHTIGFHIGTGHPLNQPGKMYYKTAWNLKELSMGLENVLAELEDFTVTEFK